MPSLPEAPAEPTRAERLSVTVQRAVGAVVGTHVAIRLVVFLALAVVGASFAPAPWSQIALLGLLGIAIEVAKFRLRGGDGSPR